MCSPEQIPSQGTLILPCPQMSEMYLLKSQMIHREEKYVLIIKHMTEKLLTDLNPCPGGPGGPGGPLGPG